jgi:hypothetical protein
VGDVDDPHDTEDERQPQRGEGESQGADRPFEEGQEEVRPEAHGPGDGAGAAVRADPAKGLVELQGLLRIVGLGLVHRILDRRPVYDL